MATPNNPFENLDGKQNDENLVRNPLVGEFDFEHPDYLIHKDDPRTKAVAKDTPARVVPDSPSSVPLATPVTGPMESQQVIHVPIGYSVPPAAPTVDTAAPIIDTTNKTRDKQGMPTAAWYAVYGTAFSATVGGAVGAGIGFLIAGPGGVPLGYALGTGMSAALTVVVPETLMAADALTKVFDKKGNTIGAAEWLEARRQDIGNGVTAAVTTLGELRDVFGDGITMIKTGARDFIQGRINGFVDNGITALATTAAVTLPVLAFGGPAGVVFATGMGLKALDALLPEGYQPLNYGLRTVSDVASAVFNNGQMVLESQRDGVEPKLLDKRYKELSTAVEKELEKRGISVTQEQLKGLVDPLAAAIAKKLDEKDQSEFANLGEFRTTLRKELAGDNGLISTELRTQYERYERELAEARQRKLDGLGLGETFKTAVMHKLVKLGIADDQLSSQADVGISYVEKRIEQTRIQPAQAAHEYMVWLDKEIDKRKPNVELVQDDRTQVIDDPGKTERGATDVKLNKTPEPGKVVIVNGDKIELSSDAMSKLGAAIRKGAGSADLKSPGTALVILDKIKDMVTKPDSPFQEEKMYDMMLKQVANHERYKTTADTPEEKLGDRLVAVLTKPNNIAIMQEAIRSREEGSGRTRGGDTRSKPDARKPNDSTQAD